MGKLTLDELRKLREQERKEMKKRDTEGKEIQVIIGMGTCGIAAGARDVLDSFMSEVEKNGLENVLIKQTGCMGLCASEPTVEVIVPGMPKVVYGNVDKEIAAKIVGKHILNQKLVSGHIFDYPAADNIVK